MIYELSFGTGTLDAVAKIKKSDKPSYKKLEKILNELIEHPRTGTGHPEPLKGGGNITWSRHISKKDRIVYDIFDEKVLVNIVQIGNHYADK